MVSVADYKQAYKTIMEDHFPDDMVIKFGDQTLYFKKRTWKIPDEHGDLVEKGLRYGENPGQEAALYELVNGNLVLGDCKFIDPHRGLVSSLNEESLLQFGKHPGKINLTDIDNALNILRYVTQRPAACIMKHNNPCGVSYGTTISEAYAKANMADRIAAFGGCAAFNRPVDNPLAEMINQNYLEVVVAPEYEESSLEILKRRKNLRIVRLDRIDQLEKYRKARFVDFKSLIDGGLIIQQSPLNRIQTKDDFSLATATYQGREYNIERLPTEQEFDDMLFGWAVEQGITSNSVIYVKRGVTVGIGTGEQDRVGVAEIAIFKAYTKYADALCFQEYGLSYKGLEEEIARGRRPISEKEGIDYQVKAEKGNLVGSVMISDGFFPFRDSVDVSLKEGIRAVVQPGGSLRDFESIQACNEAEPQVTMVFAGQRVFKH
jgi:phosphoribosylaminoimidazolecarboxamide formyltransferase/IMP cyclohydrolase